MPACRVAMVARARVVAAGSAGGGKTIEVKAVDLASDPSEFEASPGDTIKLTNEGQLEHDMASETLDTMLIDVLASGESGEYVIPDDASGEIEIHCTIPGHKEAGMIGKIRIRWTGAEIGGVESAPAAHGGEVPEKNIDIEAGDLYFEPAAFEVLPGDTITITSVGQLEQDFAVDEWGGVLIGPLREGGSGYFTVPDDATPRDIITFYCSIPGYRQAGMTGALTVVVERSGS